MLSPNRLPIDRAALAKVFPDPRTLKAFEQALQLISPAGAVNATGEIIPFGGQTAPDGWLVCDGSLVSRTAYPDLFNVLGTIWGAGDGVTTFALPDLRGRTLIGASATMALGTTGGASSVTLSVNQLPVHSHAVTDPGHTHLVTDPGHTHAVTDAGHTHTVTDTGHVHGVTDTGHAHTITDNGHTHTAAAASGVVQSGTGSTGAVAANTGSATTGITINSHTTGVSVDSAMTGVAVQTHTTGVTNQNANTGLTNQNANTGVTVGNTGNGDAVPTLPPYAAVTYLIKT